MNAPVEPAVMWKEWGLQMTANGSQPLANLSNAVTILESDPTLKGKFWRDTFLQRTMTDEPTREWGDADDMELSVYIQSGINIPKMGTDIVAKAVMTVAHRHPRNCMRDFLDSLKHDGTARIDQFFSDHMGAPQNDYVAAVGRNFWLSMVARVYQPGCKVDHMPVLEGSQGLGKSSALAIIGGPGYAEQHESATNPKAFCEVIQGKTLIEISEMDAFSRVEVSRVKQTISCQSDRFRASYARYAADHPRTCVFVGTTNRDDWNRDETGARRFWPIACNGQINLEGIRQNRDQLYAEAVARYKVGEPYWEMPNEQTRGEQESRYQPDPWLEKVREVLKGKSQVTTNEVLTEMGVELVRRGRTEQMRVGQCLRFLRWKRRRAGDGNRDYLYFPAEE